MVVFDSRFGAYIGKANSFTKIWLQIGIWQWLRSSLNQTAKPFLNGLPFCGSVQFGLGLSFLNRFELGLGWLKPNRTDLGQTSYQAG